MILLGQNHQEIQGNSKCTTRAYVDITLNQFFLEGSQTHNHHSVLICLIRTAPIEQLDPSSNPNILKLILLAIAVYNHIITQQMNMACQYFSYEKYDQEDDKSEISELVLLDEAPYKNFDDFNDENEPSLADSPLDEEKKELSTFGLTEEVDSRTQLQTEAKSDDQTDIFFQQKTIDKYKEVFKGTKDDTVQLNINFKTLIVHYFRELKMLNELNEYEISRLEQFSERVPSFASLMIFLQRKEENEGIRERVLEFFSSTQCIKRIFTGRSKMKTKLQMIKFIQKVRWNVLTKGKGYKWKDVIKREK